MDNVIKVLEERGLLSDMTNPDVAKILESPCVVYSGFDPTSESLQVGNLVSVMVLAHFQRSGHRPIAVVGGATGMIGDPSGKSSERNLLSAEMIEKNQAGIHENLSRFLDFDDSEVPAKIVNNNDWMNSFSFVEFLRDVGKHFRIGSMLGKESVRTRIDSESGMSFAEFSYQLLQAYDFLKLYDDESCTFQIGGSDQWGNITAGIDLVRKLRSVEVYGVTMPLVCDSNGQKFGKSEAGAIYLDANKTSCYDFYQFFVRAEDSDVISYLKIFTFLSIEEINELEESVKTAPEARLAQKKLAEEVTRIVHGQEGLDTALRASSVLFGGSMDGMTADDLMVIFADVGSTEMNRTDVEGAGIMDVAASSGLCKSKGEARRLIENGGMYINNAKVKGIDDNVTGADIVDGSVLVLRSGKKNYHLVKIVG